MYCYRKVKEDLYWVGANDRRLAMFEGVYSVPDGVSYNSYLLMDEKTVLFDTVDKAVSETFFENVEAVLGERSLDYVVVHHMEPDHSATLDGIVRRSPDIKIICNAKIASMMKQFFTFDVDSRAILMKEGDTFSTGKHNLVFVMAPMVHWPEVMVSYDTTDKILFSADAFGTFGALNGALFADEVNFERDYLDEARRYYTNIVGKYGPHVQALLKKASGIDIKMICPLHGPVWRTDLGYLIDKYDKWSRYEPEEKGVLIVYASMYGNTENAARILATKLVEKGLTNIAVYDVSNTHVSYLISESFRYSHIVLASVTYNLGMYPLMHNYLMDMKALNLQKRKVALMENGSWAVKSGTRMQDFLEGMKQMEVLDTKLTISSALRDENLEEMDAFAERILESVQA